MNCPHCGAENGDRNLRCSLCGKPMSQGPAGMMPQPMQPGTASRGPQGEAADPLSQVDFPGEGPSSTRRPGQSYDFIYDEAARPEQDRQGFLQPPPGMKSYSERPTYRDEQPAAPAYKPKIFFAMNRRLLPSAILLILAGSLFIIATYMPWVKTMGGNADLTGWDLYHAGKEGLNGGNAFYIPDVLKINNDYDAKSGALLTGLWTLIGGILLLVLAIVVPLFFRSYLLNVTAALGLVLLIVTGINLVTMLVAGASLLWPIYVLPPVSLIVIITAIDAHRAF
jgi:hypothetical protein